MLNLQRQVSTAKDFLNLNKHWAVNWPALFVAFVFAAMYFLTAIPRIFYPYDLDFVEDSMLMESIRFANDQPIFIPPSADFVPHVYMPLYSWLGGLLFKVTGPSYIPLRLLSLTATLSTSGLIYWIAWSESGLGWMGIVCAGLFLGGYRINGFWYELVRVDALFAMLALSGLTLGVYGVDSQRWLILSAIVLALAFFTKQTGAVFGIGLALYLLMTIKQRAWPFVLVFSLLTIVPVILLNNLTKGWFLYYTFNLASSVNPIKIERIVDFVSFELLGLMAGLTVMTIGAGLLGIRKAGLRVIRDQPWLTWMGTAIVVSGIGRASVGGNLNNLMPAYALLCLAPAILTREWNAQSELFDSWRTNLITMVILVQFALGVYNPLRYIPNPAMHRGGSHLIERIASINGKVLVLMHPYYAWLAGKEPAAQAATMWYIHERGKLALPPDFITRIKQHYYAAIISDNSEYETEPSFQQLLNTYYKLSETLEPSASPPTTTGVVVQPMMVYIPR